MPKSFKFHINNSGELGAGLLPYTEEVTVTVENDTGDDEEFTEHMRLSLKEWFDGSSVLTEAEHQAVQDKLKSAGTEF